jgi:Tol biopolymer transport system component
MELGDYAFRLSPDGQQLAFLDLGTSSAEDLWLLELRRGVRTPLTRTPDSDGVAVWAPNGPSLVYATMRNDVSALVWASPGTGAEADLYSSGHEVGPTSWSSDGRYLLYMDVDSSEIGLWVLPLSDTTPPKAGPPRRVASTRTRFRGSDFSPDGRWIAYGTLDSGSDQVFVVRAADGQGARQVSTTGGAHPRWRRDGRELFYVTPTGGIMAVAVETRTDGSLEMGTPTLLFETGRPLDDVRSFDVAADGKRFLVLSPRPQAGTGMITLITNWTQLLKP